MPLSKKDKQRISQKIAELERRQKAADECYQLGNWLLENWENEDIHPKVMMAGLAKLERLSKEAGAEISPTFKGHMDEVFQNLRDVDEWANKSYRQFKSLVTAVFGQLDYMSRKPMESAMCSNCHKRPAHFGSLCGRCAEELGVRPTGKV